uniref:Immunoglobulin V-set domain-containing protein n=1 Tax=Cyprinodon variegatus TaxID=28743 RepID=A0A3Q2E5U7_CYPVA
MEGMKQMLDQHHYKVHYNNENGKDPAEEQDKDYRGRAKMKDDPLKTGDLSLTLYKPKKRDSGKYYCRVYNQDIRRKATVHLEVKGFYNWILPAA